MKKIIIVTFAISLLLFGCGKSEEKTDVAGEKSGKPGNKKPIENAIIVMTEEVQNRDLDRYVRTVGKLSGITDVNVFSTVSGKVVEVYKNLGDWVEKDEAIGRIDNSEYINQLKQAEAGLLAAEASLEMAELNINSSEELYKNEHISQNEYLLSKVNLKNSQALYNGALANVEMRKRALENSQFIAPVAGYIAELKLEVGENINMGSMVAGIVNTSKMLLKSGVSETDIMSINKGDQVTVIIDDSKVFGKVRGVGIRPSTGGNNYPIEIVFDNAKRDLFPGQVVEARIFSQTYKNVIYTAIENLRKKYDQSFLYVINSKNRAEIRKVTLGEKVSGKIIVTSGLKIGDKLVIDGIDSLSENSLVEIKNGFNSK